MSRTARSKASPASSQRSASRADSVERDAIPHFAVCRSSTRRLVALSSTMSRRLPSSAGCTPMNSRCRAAGNSPIGATTVKKKVEPRPGPSLCAHIRPPMSSASRRLIASPRPVPPYLRVVDESACENDWNSLPMASTDRPMPVSRTANVISDFALGIGFAPTERTTSPLSVNLTALERRFSRICRSRVTSPTIASGTSPTNS